MRDGDDADFIYTNMAKRCLKEDRNLYLGVQLLLESDPSFKEQLAQDDILYDD